MYKGYLHTEMPFLCSIACIFAIYLTPILQRFQAWSHGEYSIDMPMEFMSRVRLDFGIFSRVRSTGENIKYSCFTIEIRSIFNIKPLSYQFITFSLGFLTCFFRFMWRHNHLFHCENNSYWYVHTVKITIIDMFTLWK